MVESIFPNLDPERFDEIIADLVREAGVLVFSDSVMSIWDLNGDKYILPPVEDAPAFDDILERAVLEAGFATEPLRHCLQELFECMYLRMLEDGMRGFSEREWRAVLEAKELLGHT